MFGKSSKFNSNHLEDELEILNPFIEISYSNNSCPIQEIEIIDNNTSYNKFFEDFLCKNKPCLIKSVTSSWKSTKKWTKNNEINYEYLKENYGTKTVPVADCDNKYFNSQKKIELTFLEYLNYLESSKENPLLYLKDWHCQKDSQNGHFYEVPVYFSSDWLNEYLIDIKKDDYMFVYIGPSKSWTPFHRDVFSSYSWSVNLIGKKRWLFYPPGTEVEMKDDKGNLPYDSTKISKNIKYIEIYQETGDAIFVPSGWYHQVYNLKPTISINHNWINGCNIDQVWDAMNLELDDVKKEISDCSDSENWLDMCQKILKASFGMNFDDFFNLVQHIAKKRMNFLKDNLEQILIFNKFHLGLNHSKFDLLKIKNILILFIQNDDNQILNKFDQAQILLEKIENFF